MVGGNWRETTQKLVDRKELYFCWTLWNAFIEIRMFARRNPNKHGRCENDNDNNEVNGKLQALDTSPNLNTKRIESLIYKKKDSEEYLQILQSEKLQK